MQACSSTGPGSWLVSTVVVQTGRHGLRLGEAPPRPARPASQRGAACRAVPQVRLPCVLAAATRSTLPWSLSKLNLLLGQLPSPRQAGCLAARLLLLLLDSAQQGSAKYSAAN